MLAKLSFLAGVALLVLATAGGAGADNGGFTPVTPESPNADGIRDTFLFVSIFAILIFLLVQVALVAFVVRYRRRRRARFEEGAQIHGSTRLELLWTAVPVLILVGIGFFVFLELPQISDTPEATAGAPDEVLEVDVIGRQFYFQYEYPNGVTTIDTLRAPAGVPVRVRLTAPDWEVIHSWWIPALHGKLDAIPGTVNELEFRADDPGVYEGQCTELCGALHAKMVARAEILPVDEFDAWLEQQAEAQRAGSSDLGEQTWDGVCAKCHGENGEGGIAPRIAGSVVLRDARQVEQIVRNGIRAMPPVGRGWSEQHVEALTTYLRESPPSGQ